MNNNNNKPTISIELDRKSHAYYPGETVKGTVRLSVPSAGVVCQGGVFLDFRAKATSEWTVVDNTAANNKPECNSNNNNNNTNAKRLSGETVFQHQVQTLLGRTYETGALRTSGQKEGQSFMGEAIDFDTVPGLGVVYIPCDEDARTNMTLLVEVNGGVAKVKVPKLVEETSSDETEEEEEEGGDNNNSNNNGRPFHLTTKVGNMSKAPIYLSGEFVPYKSIYPTEEEEKEKERISDDKESTENENNNNNNGSGAEGNTNNDEAVKSNTNNDNEAAGKSNNDNKPPLCFVLRVHRVKGIKRGTSNVFVRVHHLKTTTAEQQQPLPEQAKPISDEEAEKKEHLVELPTGETSFPFSFVLRDDAPGSAFWQIGSDTASMTYSLNAYVDMDQKDSHHSTTGSTTIGTHHRLLFTVLPNRPLPRPALLSPHQMESGDQPQFKFNGCCRPRGIVYTVSIKLCLGRLAYAVGEVIDLTGCTVVNNSSAPQPVQIVLRAYLQQNNGSYGQKNLLTHDTILFESVVEEKKTVVLTNLPNYKPIRVPPTYPSYAGLFLDASGTKRCEACVKWAYTLEIRLTEWGNGFFCRTPFLIPAVPPYTSILQERRHMKSEAELVGEWSIFQHAVSSTKDCETGPTLRRPQDFRGQRVVAKQAKVLWVGSNKVQEHETWIQTGNNQERLTRWKSNGVLQVQPEDDDDNHNNNNVKDDGNNSSDMSKLYYRNVVNRYAGPSGNLKIDV